MTFEYNGLHMMADIIVQDKKKLTNPVLGEKLLEKIVESIDMTMILPPLTVKFPHATCELSRVVKELEAEGLSSSNTAISLRKALKERKEEAYGYSTFVMIAESHISMHTFPEFGYFSFDCYSCKWFDEKKVLATIKEIYDVKKIIIQSVERRIPDVDKV